MKIKKSSRIAMFVMYPVIKVSNFIFRLIPHNRKVSIFIIGVTISFCGVILSKVHCETIIMHYLVDFLGYALHGAGLIPVFKVIEPFID